MSAITAFDALRACTGQGQREGSAEEGAAPGVIDRHHSPHRRPSTAPLASSTA